MVRPHPSDLSLAPLAVQAAEFERIVLGNPVVATIVDRLPRLDLPDCWLAAGALFQTVWNHLSGRAPQTGIRDYDVLYFDDADLSWEAENEVIGAVAEVFADLVDADHVVEARNEARVHLWYERRFGVPCPPYSCTAEAVATFPNASSCLAVRTRRGGPGLEILAPKGFGDLYALRAVPNPVLAPRGVYLAKTSRWQQEWPDLIVVPWPVPAVD